MTSRFPELLLAAGAASDIVLESCTTRISRTQLLSEAECLAVQLKAIGARSVALLADNGVEWLLIDLACQLAGIAIIPLPLFFSTTQLGHAIASGGADSIISDRELGEILPGVKQAPALRSRYCGALRIYRERFPESTQVPPKTQKITFTSGTTGTPKGVCLSTDQQITLAQSLVSVIDVDRPRHLCLLPLSTLLENLAGVYAPLIAGGTVVAPPLADVGLTGSSGLATDVLTGSIDKYRPHSLILVPEMLNALDTAMSAGWQPPQSLQFVAVGGGKVSPELLRRARRAGLPAFEGYGLSECSSVVSLNVPSDDQVGAAGKPLPHVRVETIDGEIVVSGCTFLGYANQPDSWGLDRVHTGDIGHIDESGFVHIDGRIKHQIITSYGRNLSPEWVETELLAGTLLKQAVVVGDDRPYCVALVYPRDPSSSDRDIDRWIASANRKLPDYACIEKWFRLAEPLTCRNGLLTENGRPKRGNIEQAYQFAISDLYEFHKEVSSL